MAARDFDLVLWGATGFTGRLVAEHLAAHYGHGHQLRWAIGGRSRDKLETLAAALADDSGTPALVTGDSDDADSMAALAARTRVVCSTVGPYARHGTPLVAACADAGTHYCDLTGEVPWMATTIEQFGDRAAASGARIVHSCGFDSVPSDLGTWFVQREMLSRHGVAGRRVHGRVGRSRGGASGGTVASLLGVMEAARRDRRIRRLLSDPYSLNPPGAPRGPDRDDSLRPYYDPVFRQWTGPFVMAAINTRVVRRSNALLAFPWGEDFAYDERQLCRSRAQATLLAGAIGGAMAAMAVGPTRRLAGHFLPSPGEGPDAEERQNGFFELFLHAQHPEDPSLDLRARVSGDRDPGYGATSRMLGEAAASLALDDLPVRGGIWTPATAFGDALLARLHDRAGLRFELV
ncbi:saccharopine dehydrogenase family protein [Pseudohaliea rubra]|uniref:Putative membrane protein n=1 Tax=Pseudohaliea rubra DSM 19751 TaxID=1265313 RepID=A0A095X2S2_9GAMM|nr:saccharopine dehydrogenase NADP-binding domain-containing protein [Pseudohaliea rubra]KGE05159.1 putative membrane protein [Pseudohaliea rubra DSM 19751]